jgi:hypothetical protein
MAIAGLLKRAALLNDWAALVARPAAEALPFVHRT